MRHPVDYAPSQNFGDNPTSKIRPGSTDYWIIEQFGNYQPDGHTGTDYPCPVGTPVRAAADGVVLHVGFMGGTYADNPWWISPSFAGYVAVIDHGSFIGIYGHCLDSSAGVAVGDRVTEGQVFIRSGNTGASTGPHLHFEVLPDGYVLGGYMYGRINPATLFGGSIQVQAGTITPIEEIDVAAEENILARLAQIVEWQEAQFREVRDNDERNRNMLAGFVRDVVTAKETITPEQLDAKLTELTATNKPAGQQIFKGKESPEVYAWDGAAGFRHIDQAEYLALITTGANLTELPQAIIEGATK